MGCASRGRGSPPTLQRFILGVCCVLLGAVLGGGVSSVSPTLSVSVGVGPAYLLFGRGAHTSSPTYIIGPAHVLAHVGVGVLGAVLQCLLWVPRGLRLSMALDSVLAVCVSTTVLSFYSLLPTFRPGCSLSRPIAILPPLALYLYSALSATLLGLVDVHVLQRLRVAGALLGIDTPTLCPATACVVRHMGVEAISCNLTFLAVYPTGTLHLSPLSLPTCLSLSLWALASGTLCYLCPWVTGSWVLLLLVGVFRHWVCMQDRGDGSGVEGQEREGSLTALFILYLLTVSHLCEWGEDDTESARKLLFVALCSLPININSLSLRPIGREREGERPSGKGMTQTLAGPPPIPDRHPLAGTPLGAKGGTWALSHSAYAVPRAILRQEARADAMEADIRVRVQVDAFRNKCNSLFVSGELTFESLTAEVWRLTAIYGI
ncbi:hypothetical protein KIPB_006574 [Kipferlia bialata]|uniref:Uncharacterized protein n=1 Tax=Kipferlia bialata TaxID=797122 RepID=A0A9K3GI94_9EUKA|nr:hypothetical protein KIPB_006574 [Kipferlia bialata]|eukprot:g6574.t1